MRIVIFNHGGTPDDIGHFIREDITEIFLEFGHQVETISLERPVPFIDMINQFRKFNPHLLFTLNFIGVTPDFISLLEKMKIPIVSWVVDKFSSFKFLERANSPYYHIFVATDRGDVKSLREVGFSKVYFLPAATNPKRFRKIPLSYEDRKRYGCRLSLVGSSGSFFFDYWERYLSSVGDLTREALEEILRLYMHSLNHNLKEDLSHLMGVVEERYGFSFVFKDDEHKADILNRLYYTAGKYSRKELVEAVCDLGLHLFGDDGWQRFETTSLNYKGRIDYRIELPKLYNASEINLAIAGVRIPFDPRIADILACGGFVLAIYVDGLEEFFELNKEIVCFEDKEELRKKIEYFLSHPKEREKIANAGQERVLREYTYRHWMEKFTNIIREIDLGKCP